MLALDTSKDFTDTEQLAVFIWGVIADFKIYKEFLTLGSIHGSMKGTDIFREFQTTFLEAQLDPSKLFPVAAVECPSMLGANQRLQGLINKWHEENVFSPVTWHHCIVPLYQESLVDKSFDMSTVTKVVISTISWIQANTLNY